MDFPSPELRRGLVMAYAALRPRVDALGAERPIVLPTAEFFPDLFTGDEASVQRLLDRLLDHAGLSEMAIVARFWGENEALSACGTGACGSCGPSEPEPESIPRLVDAGDTWQVNVLAPEASQPVVLTSALCRAIALAVLNEADALPQHLDLDRAVDLAAVELGYGVLLLEGSHIYRKSCAGPSIARTTALGPGELALVLALSGNAREQSLRKLGKHLSATQREALSEACAWADSNRPLIHVLRSDPARIAGGQFELEEPRSWLGRWLTSKLRRTPNAAQASTIEELEAALERTPNLQSPRKARDPKLEEARRLVDDALG